MSKLDTSAGFRIRGRLCGKDLHYQDIAVHDTATYYKGDLVNVESGYLDPAVTTDTAMVGPVMETVSCTTLVTKVRVCVDPDVILEVYDANARVIGATLDISGAAGAQTVGGTVNAEFVVYETSTATEPTLVIFNQAVHLFLKDQ